MFGFVELSCGDGAGVGQMGKPDTMEKGDDDESMGAKASP